MPVFGESPWHTIQLKRSRSRQLGALYVVGSLLAYLQADKVAHATTLRIGSLDRRRAA